MRFWLTVLVVLALFGLAVRHGRGPERFAATSLAANFFLTFAIGLIHGQSDYRHVDPVLFSIDVATYLIVTWVALRANRVWPLVVASLQLIVVFAHISGFIYYGWNQVYWGMMISAQYVALFVTALGTFTHHAREKRIGRYRSWRVGGFFARAPASPNYA